MMEYPNFCYRYVAQPSLDEHNEFCFRFLFVFLSKFSFRLMSIVLGV